MNRLQIIEHQSQRVLTTHQLAESYETETANIKMNLKNHKNRFIEGRDYFCLKGNELKEFKNLVNDIYLVRKDVAMILGYVKTTDAVRKHVYEEDRGISKIEIPSGTQEMTIINESGLYSLIFAFFYL